jgi:hypothetical protein
VLAGVGLGLGIGGDWATAAIAIGTTALFAVIIYYSLKLYTSPLVNRVELAPDRMTVMSFGSFVRVPYTKVASVVPDQTHPRSFWHWPRVPDSSRPHVDVILHSRFLFYGNGFGWPVRTLHLAVNRPGDFKRELELAKDRALHS